MSGLWHHDTVALSNIFPLGRDEMRLLAYLAVIEANRHPSGRNISWN
jgi:hypothetical protein